MTTTMHAGVYQAGLRLENTAFEAQTCGCDCCSQITDIDIHSADDARRAIVLIDEAIMDWEQAAHDARIIRAKIAKVYRV